MATLKFDILFKIIAEFL